MTARPAGQQATSCFLLPSAGITGNHSHTWLFTRMARIQTQARTADVSLIVLSPQPSPSLLSTSDVLTRPRSCLTLPYASSCWDHHGAITLSSDSSTVSASSLGDRDCSIYHRDPHSAWPGGGHSCAVQRLASGGASPEAPRHWYTRVPGDKDVPMPGGHCRSQWVNVLC